MPGKRRFKPVEGRRGYGPTEDNGDGGAVRYGAVDAELLRECIDAVTFAGDAMQLSRTADGGAYVVRVLSDAGNGVWYPPTAEGLCAVLTRCSDIARGL